MSIEEVVRRGVKGFRVDSGGVVNLYLSLEGEKRHYLCVRVRDVIESVGFVWLEFILLRGYEFSFTGSEDYVWVVFPLDAPQYFVDLVKMGFEFVKFIHERRVIESLGGSGFTHKSLSYLKEFISILEEIYSEREEDREAFVREAFDNVDIYERTPDNVDYELEIDYAVQESYIVSHNGVLFAWCGDGCSVFLNNSKWVGEGFVCSHPFSRSYVKVDVTSEVKGVKRFGMCMWYGEDRFYLLRKYAEPSEVVMYVGEVKNDNYYLDEVLSIPVSCVDDLIEYLRRWYRRYCEAYLYPLVSAFDRICGTSGREKVDRCGDLIFSVLERELKKVPSL